MQYGLCGGIIVHRFASIEALAGGQIIMPPGEKTLPEGFSEFLLVPGRDGLAAAQDPGSRAVDNFALRRKLMRKTRRLGDLGLDLLALEQELQSVAGWN